MSFGGEAPIPIGQRAGEYEITGLLGRGGMGTVYAGIHPIIGKAVAIKVLSPELATSSALVERFVREARAVNQIRHRNIVDVFAFGHTPDLGHYFVMPLLEGENLQQRIRREPMTPAELAPILDQLTGALDAAHAAGIYHRDLKPENLFLVRESDGSDTVQILDFGIAKLTGDDAVSATQTGTQMGTPLYMAPEQWEGRGIDHRSDIYALGVLVHHAVTGDYPFEARTPLTLMNAHANAQPILPSAWGAPAWLDGLVGRAMAKGKADRFGTAGELGRVFRHYVEAADDPLPASAVAATVASTVEPIVAAREPGRPWLIVVLVVGVLAAGSVAAVLATGDGSSGEQAAVLADAGPAAVVVAADAGTAAVAVTAAPPDAQPAPPDARPASRREPPRPRPRTRPRQPEPREATPPPDARERPPVQTPGWGETVDPYGGN